MTRLLRDDWLAAGFDVLVNEGAPALTIDTLTRKLNVTKGSFYHHFRNADDYQNALLESWEQQYTARVIEMSEAAGDPALVFDRFSRVLASELPDIEICFRSWAFQDERVRSYVQRVDEARIAQARRWFEMMGYDSTRAEGLARMLYALLVGCYSIFPPVQGEILQKTMTEFLQIASKHKEEA
ncbi:TetR family transcriptional regulator (plasmid) [Leptolinea sp. HRD-7]|nr:TetR family transcriptional regulator [Leptolinea sp. HRD-7]